MASRYVRPARSIGDVADRSISLASCSSRARVPVAVLTRQEAADKWGTATYSLVRTGAEA
jgi:hypothetical protein